MKLNEKCKVVLNGLDFDNPLDLNPYPKKDYSTGKESARISFRKIWLDRYVTDGQRTIEYWSCELKLLSNGKAYLDGKEIKDSDEVKTVKEIFDNIKIST